VGIQFYGFPNKDILVGTYVCGFYTLIPQYKV